MTVYYRLYITGEDGRNSDAATSNFKIKDPVQINDLFLKCSRCDLKLCKGQKCVRCKDAACLNKFLQEGQNIRTKVTKNDF